MMMMMMCEEEERSMEVLPLSAKPFYCLQMKEEGTPVTYHMSKMSDTQSSPGGALRLSELVDELSTSAARTRTTTMTFDERIRNMGIVARVATSSGGDVEKVLELLNTTLYQIVLDDVEEDKARRRDYSQFLVEYVDIVRDARDAKMSREHTLLLSRAFRAIQIVPRDVDDDDATTNAMDTLATLNANLHGKIAHDLEGGVVARDYSPFFVRYVQIASDAEETPAEDIPRARELLVQAYKASNVPIGEE
jgi:hypothetical protein